MSGWNTTKMRRWVRAHWAGYIEQQDLPDMPPEMEDEDGFKIYSEESKRIARLIRKNLNTDWSND